MKNRFLLLSQVLIHACGAAPGDPPAGDQALLPIAVGNRWIYDEVRLKDDQLPATLTKEVIAEETFGDRSTRVLLTTQTNSPITKRSNWWQDGKGIWRLRQQRLNDSGELVNYRTYEPGFLRLRRRLQEVGDHWVEQHVRRQYDTQNRLTQEKTKQYTWFVEAVDESVTVPAGRFSCVRVKRVERDGDYKIYWYARGVGKVLERDAKEEERLREYALE